MKEAKIYLAGAIFDTVSDSAPLTRVQQFLSGYLAESGLTAPAPSVYLEKSRFGRAGLFLESGFDVVPADSETYQIALSALFDAGRENAPSEFIFGFADQVPDRFLRKLQGIGKRTILSVGGGIPPECDAWLDLGALFAESGTGFASAKGDSAKAGPAKPEGKQPVIIPLPPREPELQHFSGSAKSESPRQAVPPAAEKPVPQTPAPAAAAAPAAVPPVAPAAPAAAKPAAPAKSAVPPAPAKPAPVSSPVPTPAADSAELPAPAGTPAPAAVAPVSPQIDISDLVQAVGNDTVQLEISVKDQVKELLRALGEKRIPLSELAASIRMQPSEAGKGGSVFVQPLLPEDIRSIDDGGQVTVCRTDQPELDPVPAQVGAWLLQNDRLLNSELNEMVSEHSSGVSLAELADKVKSLHPILDGHINEEWIASHLPHGVSSYRPASGPVAIRVQAPPLTKPISIYPDFESVSKRAALMKDFCRWRVRKEKKGTDAENQRKESDFFQQAKYLFVNLGALPADMREEDVLMFADCYEALEIITRLLAACLDGKLIPTADRDQIGQCCADSICLLKTALLEKGIELSSDGVQRDAYDELSKFTKQYRVFLQNMKFEDRMNVADRKDIKNQFQEMERRLTRQDTAKKKKQLQGRINYHLDKIKDALPGDIHDWNVVVASVTELVQECGVTWTSDEIKGYLKPFIGKIPEEVEMTDLFIRIVQYIEVGADPEALRRPTHMAVRDLKISPAVRKVRKAYKGTKMVFVGGTPQPHIIERLKLYLQVEDVLWEEHTHGDSLSRFQSALNDEAVRLVAVYIPWCSHKHSEEFKKMVSAAGKDFVRVTKGTNPDTIAAAICEQIHLK
ncbi:MAG: hypothetical protein IJG60_07645 [Thermoguttaceae bacterium]|nr:hypothetical protein [Thermoguttaceae bacterium]